MATQEGFSAWVFDASGDLITTATSQGVRGRGRRERRQRRSASPSRAATSPSRSPAARRWSPPRSSATASIDGAVLARADTSGRATGGDRRRQGRPHHRAARRRSWLPSRSRSSSRARSPRGSRSSRIQRRRSARASSTARSRAPEGATRSRIWARALETMRAALRQTFEALRSERDRLSAIFDALSDAVMVVGPDGTVRFSNPAARPLIYADGKVAATLIPWLRRASRTGTSEHDGLRIGERVYAHAGARDPGRGRGPGRRPRPDGRASARARGARVRLERRARAPQSARRNLGCGRGPARRREGRPRGARALPSPARAGHRADHAA